ALAFLAGMLARRQYWRPALDAYKASLALDSTAEVRAAYETLRDQHGFRVLDYSVDSDALTPRMCVKFSEQLAGGRIDFAKFVQVDGKDPAAVTADGQQLCIEGFRHGERYKVALRAGVPSTVNEPLAKPSDFVVYVRDRKASVRFTGRNYVLPRSGQRGIPVVSVNTKSVDVAIYRIGDRGLGSAIVAGNVHKPLDGGEINRLTDDKGQKVWSGEMPVDAKLNKDVTTAFPIGEAVPELAPGVYVMVATPAGTKGNYWESRATQWFVVSDLGLASIAGTDGMHVFVRSLATADPIGDAEVKLVARNNDVLATAKSDARGVVKFDPGLTRGKGGLAPAVLVATGPQADYAFLDLTKAGFDLSDRGVTGRAPPAALDAFVFTERGVYRPGAEVHVTALLRDRKAKAALAVPLTLIFNRPDGVEHRRTTVADAGLGGRTYSLALLETAMTGTWRVAVYADPKGEPVGETSFLVEDFVPERMELTLKPDGTSIASGRKGQIDLDGRYLYGAPAADLAVEGDVVVRPLTGDLKGFAGYRFGLADEKVTPVRRPLLELPRTDAGGKARIAVPLPPVPETTRPLEARVTLRLREPGGRAVGKTVGLAVERKTPMIGIRPAFKDNHVGEGGTAGFDVLALGADGKQSARTGLRWQLFKIDRRFQWYQQDGSWRYEPVTYTQRVSDGTIDAKADEAVRIDTPVRFGRYRLEVTSGGPDGPATSVEFTAGWYAAGAAETPDFLDIALDKANYRPGETARVTLTPRAPGKALIAVVDQGVIDMKAVDVTGETATVDFEVSDAWRPGAYVTAMLYRPMDVATRRMPRRSVGVAWLGLDRDARELGLTLGLPEKTEPLRDLEVPIEVSGLTPGKPARLVVAAVDVGILNLTNYKPPAPEDWYYAQRKLGVDIRDLYGRLIDGMRATRGRIRTGGDG
ncbi:MAG: alpha-2-macroglobulin family protein, partial [Methyloligellaceae bacterium]